MNRYVLLACFTAFALMAVASAVFLGDRLALASERRAESEISELREKKDVISDRMKAMMWPDDSKDYDAAKQSAIQKIVMASPEYVELDKQKKSIEDQMILIAKKYPSNVRIQKMVSPLLADIAFRGK